MTEEERPPTILEDFIGVLEAELPPEVAQANREAIDLLSAGLWRLVDTGQSQEQVLEMGRVALQIFALLGLPARDDVPKMVPLEDVTAFLSRRAIGCAVQADVSSSYVDPKYWHARSDEASHVLEELKEMF